MSYTIKFIRYKHTIEPIVELARAISNNFIYKRNNRYSRLIKSLWGMPRLTEAMKDVISCDKLRGMAHTF